MIDGPHIVASSPTALCINWTSALASSRLVSFVSAPINAATLSSVGLFCCPHGVSRKEADRISNLTY